MPEPRHGARDFAGRLLDWFDRHGRHDLPWQHPRSAYRVWVSEVMLQQTQVVTVIPYFERFMARFPDLASLAGAELDDVLAHWSGLGYYARGRNLHAAARAVMREHGGNFPDDHAQVCALPGIGPSTAAAICAQVWNQRHAVLDGNVKRVLARHAGIEGWPGKPAIAAALQREAEARLPGTTDAAPRMADYTQAIMDLGATLCTRRPACERCPVSGDCVALTAGRTTELPTPKPRRLRPNREGHVLLLGDRSHRIWLAPRPPVGLWGGLWAPPIIDTLSDPLIERLGLDLADAETLPAVDHAFTHFDWHLTPWLWRGLAPTVSAADTAGDWVTIDDALRRGLPAPIRALLTRIEIPYS